MREAELEGPISRARIMLDELVAQVDRLEEEFAAVVSTRSLFFFIFPGSFANYLTVIPEDGAATPILAVEPNLERETALESQIRQLEESHETLSRALQSERSSHEEEVAQLEQRTTSLLAARESDETLIRDLRDNVNSLEVDRGDFGRKEADWEKERGEWKREEGRNREVLEEVVRLSQVKEEEFTVLSRTHSALEKEMEVMRTRGEKAEESLRLLKSRYDNLESANANTLANLSSTTSRLHTTESTLKLVTVSNIEKERKLRDQRIESELDRAGLENELKEVRDVLEKRDAELARTKEGIELGVEATRLLERKVVSLETDLTTKEAARTASSKEKVEELRATKKVAREALKVVGELRAENSSIIIALTAKPDPTLAIDAPTTSAPLASSPPAPALTPSPPDFENGDLADLLQRMRAYERGELTEAVKGKVESLTILTRKWQKECKNYRDRAHRATSGASEKIAFRKFVRLSPSVDLG